jgi:hypothetical protein
LLDLVIPGLLPAASPQTRLPHLERWLARADLARDSARSGESWLGRRYGLEPAPVAAIALAVDEAPQPGHWLRADPVHVRIERDTLVLHPAGTLSIEPAEASELVAALREHFAADGMEFRVPHPDRWYVRVPAGESPVTTPLPEALGHDVFGRLPRGTGKIRWAAALTEAQMMLSTHPVNLAREAARRPPVNAIWFWGEGTLPRELPRTYGRVFAIDPFAAGLAHLSGAALAPPPSSARELALGEPALVVLDEVASAWAMGDSARWESAARAIDESWFAGLGGLSGRFGGVRLVLPARDDTCVATITSAARWRLWRRGRPVSTHA